MCSSDLLEQADRVVRLVDGRITADERKEAATSIPAGSVEAGVAAPA